MSHSYLRNLFISKVWQYGAYVHSCSYCQPCSWSKNNSKGMSSHTSVRSDFHIPCHVLQLPVSWCVCCSALQWFVIASTSYPRNVAKYTIFVKICGSLLLGGLSDVLLVAIGISAREPWVGKHRLPCSRKQGSASRRVRSEQHPRNRAEYSIIVLSVGT